MKNYKSLKNRIAKNKNGFTLVELVIVIAILAILAAIAIPVITTTINSSKMSTLESDCQSIDTVIKSALVEYEANIKNVTYNTNPLTASTRVSDILAETNLSDIQLERTIGGTNYYVALTSDGIALSSISTEKLDPTTTVAYLSRTIS